MPDPGDRGQMNDSVHVPASLHQLGAIGDVPVLRVARRQSQIEPDDSCPRAASQGLSARPTSPSEPVIRTVAIGGIMRRLLHLI